MMGDTRPTKKQRELLSFIDSFIKGNGYGPSYREVMRALDYKSVSTVATHIDGLITRGWLRKKTHSARSLEVVTSQATTQPSVATASNTSHEDWLKDEIAKRTTSDLDEQQKTDLRTLAEAARILGHTQLYQDTIDTLDTV